MWRDFPTSSVSCMADVSIIRAIQDYIMVFYGAALPTAYACLKVGPLGPADGARGGEGVRIGVWCTGRGLRLHRWS